MGGGAAERAPRMATLKPMVDARAVGRPVVGQRSHHTTGSPFDGRLLVEVPTSTPADVATAAGRARKAQRGWAADPIEQRMQVLLDFHDRCSTVARTSPTWSSSRPESRG